MREKTCTIVSVVEAPNDKNINFYFQQLLLYKYRYPFMSAAW